MTCGAAPHRTPSSFQDPRGPAHEPSMNQMDKSDVDFVTLLHREQHGHGTSRTCRQERKEALACTLPRKHSVGTGTLPLHASHSHCSCPGAPEWPAQKTDGDTPFSTLKQAAVSQQHRCSDRSKGKVSSSLAGALHCVPRRSRTVLLLRTFFLYSFLSSFLPPKPQ